MEMGKLTAKLRDAVPVCLLVEGKEIKQYKNIEIPDELKILEYQDFKFDVPLNGAITFKIMFEPGVLPEEFPQTRERRTRKPLPQDAQPQGEQAAEAIPASVAEAFAQALQDAQPVADIAAAMAHGDAIKAEIIEHKGEGEGRLVVITVEPEAMEAMPEPVEATAEAEAQPEESEMAKKPARKGKGKKGAAATDDAEK